jgi:hypothetical protein
VWCAALWRVRPTLPGIYAAKPAEVAQ